MSIQLDYQYIMTVSGRLNRFSRSNDRLFNFRCNICGDSKKDTTKKRGFFHVNKKNTGFSFTCHNCGGIDGETVSFRKWLKDFDYSLYETYIFDSVGSQTRREPTKSTKPDDDAILEKMTSRPAFKRKDDATILQNDQEIELELETLPGDIQTSIKPNVTECNPDGVSFSSPDFGSRKSLVDSGSTELAIEIEDLPNLEADLQNVQRPNMDGVRRISDLPDEHGAKKYLINRKIPERYFDQMYLVWEFYSWCNSWKPNSFKPAMVQFFEEPRLIIPFYNKEGELMMIQGRSFKKDAKIRYFSIKCDDVFPKIYGLERINYDKIVQVWEGPLDSLFGDNAAAMAGADAHPSEYFDDYVIIYDNEPRNADICKRMAKTISRGDKIVIWPNNIPEKYDGNDMIMKLGLTEEQLNDIIRANTFQGLKAELAFGMWKRVEVKRRGMRKNAFSDLSL